MCYLCYMSINIKIRSEIEELFSKITFCISSNYPTSDPLYGQTNGAIFIKKILHSNFILYYNISKAQLDSSMGRHLNPCLLFRTSTTTSTTSTSTTTDNLGWNLSSRQMKFFAGNNTIFSCWLTLFCTLILSLSFVCYLSRLLHAFNFVVFSESLTKWQY